MMVIDAVIPWVDGNDEEHYIRMLPFLKDKSEIKSDKFKTRYEHVNEIKFAVDSILKFATFINNIFIVTDRQTPNFITEEKNNEKYKNVFIIDHRIIFKGYESYLPVFNNRSIDTCIHRIPNLSEHFIYFNDDVFLIQKTKPEDFFKNGLPILRGKWSSFEEHKTKAFFKKPRIGHKTAQQVAAKLLGLKNYYRFRHTPHPMRKSTLVNFFDENEIELINNINYKFRHSSQFITHGLANHLEIKNNTCVLVSNLRLLYFRSYKKSLYWYKYKLNITGNEKLFLGLQSLDRAPKPILSYILDWLKKRTQS